jgi:DNA-binding LytR/AlgR family response regulator
MDISIDGEEDGIETAKRLKSIYNYPIIFLTNISDDKTIKRAQAVKPANYLVKPFNDSQLYVSINNALYTASEQREADIRDNAQEFPDEKLKVLEGKFFSKNHSDMTYKKYHIPDILYIEASRSYCYIHMSGGERLLKTTSMKDVESKLGNPHFFRVSRSHIVNLDQVEGIKGRLLVIGSHEIKISEEYFEDIKRTLNML